MSIKKALDVINAMEADGIIERYAIAGAIAAYNYIEPTVTEDVDILISFDSPAPDSRSGLVTLSPILSYLKVKGYGEFRHEGLLIEGWPVQFLPVTDDLDDEALAQAQELEIKFTEPEGSVKSRVLGPEHIVAIALKIGRPKDIVRIIQFLDARAFSVERLCTIFRRHGLIERWREFCRRTGVTDLCELQSDQ